MWEAEVVHDFDELLTRLGQPGVEHLFLCDGAHAAALIVMAWQHQGVVWQGEELVVDVVIQHSWLDKYKRNQQQRLFRSGAATVVGGSWGKEDGINYSGGDQLLIASRPVVSLTLPLKP